MESPAYFHFIDRVISAALEEIHNRPPEVCGFSSARIIAEALERNKIIPPVKRTEHSHFSRAVDPNCEICKQEVYDYSKLWSIEDVS